MFLQESSFRKNGPETGELSQWVGALAAFLEDPGLTPTWQLTQPSIAISGGILCPLLVSVATAYMWDVHMQEADKTPIK